MNLFQEVKEGFRISWDAIRANKLRSSLTTLGIVIGIVSVTLMGTAIEGLNKAFFNSLATFGTDNIFIQKFAWSFSENPYWYVRNRRDITMRDAKRLEKETTWAAAVSTEAETMLPVKYNNKNASSVWVRGNTDQSLMVNGFNVEMGRFFSEAEVAGGRPVCVIGSAIVKNLFDGANPLGKNIFVGGSQFEVVGTLEKMGEFFTGWNLDNQVIVPLTRYVTDFAYDPNVSIIVKVRDRTKMAEAEEELRGIMRKIRRLPPAEEDDFAVNQQEAFISSFMAIGASIAALGLFITGLSLFVGGIGIMNIMFVSVAERTKEIGIRKAIGAKRRTILIQFLIEASCICLFGGFIGLLIAYPMSLGLGQFLPATMSVKVVGIALLVSLITGVISGFFPAYRAASMNPVDALRSE